MSKQRHRGRTASANSVRPKREHEANGRHESVSERPSTKGRGTPCYDAERREPRVGKRLVKRLTQESDAVEIILLAFQEENWPSILDDPLSGKHGQNAKERLRTVVKNLNRRQREPLLRFRVRRQGAAVAWEFRDERH
jgi:hypothetical protein